MRTFQINFQLLNPKPVRIPYMFKMIKLLKYFLIAVLIFMVYVVVSTSLESNLFREWDYLSSIPWMQATLWDFYANILLIALWVTYKEKNRWKAVAWIISFFFLGSIATIAYVLVQFFTLDCGESIRAVLIKRNR